MKDDYLARNRKGDGDSDEFLIAGNEDDVQWSAM